MSLRKNCPYSELFWSVFPRIWAEFSTPHFSLRISQYSVRMWENVDQNYSEYGHFSRSVFLWLQVSEFQNQMTLD